MGPTLKEFEVLLDVRLQTLLLLLHYLGWALKDVRLEDVGMEGKQGLMDMEPHKQNLGHGKA